MQAAIATGTIEVAKYFKPRMIEYHYQAFGMEKARAVYKLLAEDSIPCYELHRKMVELELMRLEPDVTQIRKCYEYQCQFFGKDHVEVWLEYIKFERNYGDPKLSPVIFKRGQATLTKAYEDLFESSYRILEIQ